MKRNGHAEPADICITPAFCKKNVMPIQIKINPNNTRRSFISYSSPSFPNSLYRNGRKKEGEFPKYTDIFLISLFIFRDFFANQCADESEAHIPKHRINGGNQLSVTDLADNESKRQNAAVNICTFYMKKTV